MRTSTVEETAAHLKHFSWSYWSSFWHLNRSKAVSVQTFCVVLEISKINVWQAVSQSGLGPKFRLTLPSSTQGMLRIFHTYLVTPVDVAVSIQRLGTAF